MVNHSSHHPRALPRRPQGQETRGKTARNRLRRVDNFVAMYDPALLQRTDHDYAQAYFVDLGYGAEPFTTLESAAHFRQLHPSLPVLGVEIDAVRVTTALPHADPITHFRLGGFNLPLQPGETVRLVRAFNVLRQYDEGAVDEAYAMLAQQVLPGGLLIEGTSDPFGRIWVAHVLRRNQTPTWLQEAIVFSTNFHDGFDPITFQTRLPKNLIHRMVPGEPIFDFFQAWKRATLLTVGEQVWGLRRWFAASAHQLAAIGYPIDRRRRWLNRGFMLWYHPFT